MSVVIRGNVRISGNNYRRRITIDHTKVPSDLTDFPTLVSVSGLSNINANGTDIRFRDANGFELAREIESYAAGVLVAWVKIPLLSSTVDTVIYMHYGNTGAQEPAANSAYGRQSVWSNGYAGVWHLKETGANSTVFDSTANANNSTTHYWTPTTGKIGRGAYREGFNGIKFPNSASLQIATALSLSVWYKYTAKGNDYGRIIVKELPTGNAPWVTYGLNLDNGIQGNQKVLFNANKSSTETSSAKTSAVLAVNSTYHIAGVYDPLISQTKIYLNGLDDTAESSFGNSTLAVNNGAFSIGTDTMHNQYTVGVYDEVRISNVARSASWIATEYANQNDPSTFHMMAGEETIGGRVRIGDKYPLD